MQCVGLYGNAERLFRQYFHMMAIFVKDMIGFDDIVIEETFYINFGGEFMKKALKQSTLIFLLNVSTVLFLIIIGVLALTNSIISGKVHDAAEERFSLTYNANRFMNGSSYLTNEVRAYATTGDEAHYDNYWNEVNELKNRDIGVENMKQIGITSEEQQRIDEMSELSNSLVPLEDIAMESVKKGDKESAIAYVYGEEYSLAISKINTIKTEFLSMLDERTMAQVNTYNKELVALEVFTLVFILCVILVQVFSFFILKRRVIFPIKDVQGAMEEIAQGNLGVQIALEADTSEIGMLVNAMKKTQSTLVQYISDISNKLTFMADGDMRVDVESDYIGDFKPIKESLVKIIDSMNNAISQINRSAKEVYQEAEQISTGAQALSQGSAEQASSIQELADTIVKISEEINQTAERAHLANEKTTLAGNELDHSNTFMQEMIAAISQMNSASSEIGKIIKTIEDIAFQTNILALNAAVEAARAGTAGKGFAVVADEVRSLAEKSAEAARTTTTLIAECVNAVKEGTQIANTTAQSLESVVVDARQVSDIIEQITRDAKEQAQSMTQATEGVNQISAVIQTNSATAQESAAASEELNSQSILLTELVGQFKLKKV